MMDAVELRQAQADSPPQPAWGLQRLALQACWQRGFTGAEVRIGHLDTGVDGSHPAMAGRVAGFKEFDLGGFPVAGALPHDSGSHGTHTAGVICGGEVGGMAVGVAPEASLCSALVIEGGLCLARLLAGLDWLLDCQVRVVCISLGVPGYNPLYEILLRRMQQAGVLLVAPVGNRGAGAACSPANYPGVLAVGAIDAADRVPRFSGSGSAAGPAGASKPDLVAPGVDIPSAHPGGGLKLRSGASMAAAHVAGVAALLFQAQPGATVADVQQALLTTCTPLPASPAPRCGRGLLNPLLALDTLLCPTMPPASPTTASPMPSSLPPYVDPRLSRLLAEAGENALLDAVIVVSDGASSSLDDGGLAQQVIDHAAAHVGERPARLRFFPRANAAVLSASAPFLREILKDPAIAAASAADIASAFLEWLNSPPGAPAASR